MKLSTSFLGIAALSFVTSALAQETIALCRAGRKSLHYCARHGDVDCRLGRVACSQEKETAATTSPSPVAAPTAEKVAKKMSAEAALSFHFRLNTRSYIDNLPRPRLCAKS